MTSNPDRIVIPEVIPLRAGEYPAKGRKAGWLRTALHMLRQRWRIWLPYALRDYLGKMAFWGIVSACACFLRCFTWGYSALFCIIATSLAFVIAATVRGALGFGLSTLKDWRLEGQFAEDVNNLQALTNAVAAFAEPYGLECPTKAAVSIMFVCTLLHELPRKEDGIRKWTEKMCDIARTGYTYLHHALEAIVDPNWELDLSFRYYSREAVEQLLAELWHQEEQQAEEEDRGDEND